MRHIVLLFMFMSLALQAGAQEKGKRKFSPEKFRADMEQFIVKDAGLTPQEASQFFPIYNEMNKKQRAVFEKMRKLDRQKPVDEAGCRNAIKQRDKYDIELKKIQMSYHEKFMTVLPASKVFDVIKAEEKFHRRMLKKSNAAQAKKNNTTRK